MKKMERKCLKGTYPYSTNSIQNAYVSRDKVIKNRYSTTYFMSYIVIFADDINLSTKRGSCSQYGEMGTVNPSAVHSGMRGEI